MVGFYWDHVFDNIPLTDLAMFLLAMPVIYHLVYDLFVKDKSGQNKALKIYSFAYICLYVLWGLIDIVGFAFSMGHISGLMAYLLYLNGLLFLAPVLYILAKDIFPKSKGPRYIFIAYVVLLFILAFIPEQLNEIGFYDTTSN
tara:strand:+ start:324 stop:752 length:429 start_codon:yes stop_codon:yes gene_type:complete